MAETALAGMLKAGVASRRGSREAAANLVRQGLSASMEQRYLLCQLAGVAVYRGDALDHFTAFVDRDDPEQVRVYVSKATWDTLNYHGPAVTQFVDDMKEAAMGMQFVVVDRPPFRDAVRNQAKAEGTDLVQAKDAITQLTERANALVLQAASLNAAPTALQQQTFAVRYALLQQEFNDLQARMDGLQDLIGLAGAALYDTTT